ncbi:MAG: PLD nuclease N-terminal domain-containing protein [Alphaproteobacteria bacterium]
MEVVGPLGLIILALDIWALVNVFGSPTTSPVGKVLWVLLILFMPLLGFVIWLVAGPRSRATAPG